MLKFSNKPSTANPMPSRYYLWAFLMMSVLLSACGTVQGVDVGTLWASADRIDGAIKLLTAGVSLGAAVLLIQLRNQITERKQAEESLQKNQDHTRLIIDTAHDAFIAMDAVGQITDWNPQAEVIFGWSREEALGRTVADTIIPLHSRGVHKRGFQHFLATGVGLVVNKRVEITALHRDGREFPVELSLSLLRLDGADTLNVFIRDITERRAVERMKDEFVSMVSHELRTPLTSIRGALGLLAGGMLGPLPKKGQHMLDIAVTNTDRLIRLINDVLDLERVTSGKITMQKQQCNTADLMTQAAEVMQAMAEKAGVTLSVSPLSAILWADPDRVLQTLTNLLSNAIKFSPSGATVWLIAMCQGEDIVFQVRDQGRGIPSDKLESIFERFQQVDVSDCRDKGGTGLGLAICRSIVQQHGGRIWAESALEQGSTFFFTLPLPREVEASPPELQGRVISTLVSSSPKIDRVLVLEDDLDLARMLATTFQRHGIEIVHAPTGREAIQFCQQQPPDLLMLDVTSPDSDSFPVVAWLRRRDHLRQLPVVVCTDRSLDSSEQERLRLGPTLFFTKGRTAPEEFEQRVIGLLDQTVRNGGEGTYDKCQTHPGH